jgi:hypothetical protein
MHMRVCYLDCREAGLCCYLSIHIENLLRPLQLFYFQLWPIYWLSLVYFSVVSGQILGPNKPSFQPYRTLLPLKWSRWGVKLTTHLHLTNVKVKNSWNYTFTPLYVLMTRNYAKGQLSCFVIRMLYLLSRRYLLASSIRTFTLMNHRV